MDQILMDSNLLLYQNGFTVSRAAGAWMNQRSYWAPARRYLYSRAGTGEHQLADLRSRGLMAEENSGTLKQELYCKKRLVAPGTN